MSQDETQRRDQRYIRINFREAEMQGLTLLATFVVMALISIVAAVFVGLVVDRLPHIHDMLSLLAFFGTLVVLLPIAWIVAVKLTAPRQITQ